MAKITAEQLNALRDVRVSLTLLSQEFDRERFGMPNYDMRSDHAYEVLVAADEDIGRVLDAILDTIPAVGG